MLISVIIVNHNTGNILKECIDSLHKYEDSTVIEIIIIDNFSSDNSREVINLLCVDYKNVQSIYTDSLISFSAANNSGIKIAKGEFILIMNPDIIFTEPVIGKLTEKLKAYPEIGAVSPALTGTDGKFQRNYFQRFPTIRQYIFYQSVLAGLFNKSPGRMNKYLENQEIDISTGQLYLTEQIPCAFFLTTKNILENMGLMDDGFILFFEDVDLSYRIRKNRSLAVLTDIKVTHLGGSSFKTEDNWWMYGRYVVSMIYFFRKHYSKSRTFFLKLLVYINSYFVILIENIKKLAGRSDSYRLKKHKYLLKLMKN
ncbi:MAG: glycosyltransferase family 2 protein [Ignavibacteria bacterium]